ncbi:MAG TPA: ATP-binding cassette domain-containing protein [Acidimicrobiales bacterium]|jgi:ABC-type branched-subunit amino acid transport system ATPase component|nr:ATP-binding cassette domain-containing protein [Acidimicrobiales bacterium]
MTADLSATDIRVRFGGLLAVDGLTLEAPGDAITGLIGPNGAGKTTAFNAMTGALSNAQGSVRLGETVLDGLGPAARAQRGLGRTFQLIQLFDTMTVRENVAMGPELFASGRHVWSHLVASRRERTETRRRAELAIDRCGLRELADHSVNELSTGQRRLVELARAMATPFRFLLLDEPSSGLDVAETEQFASILHAIVDEHGTGILLVEHDIALVRAVCTSAYVLDFGKLIYRGATADVLSNEMVKAAYLGSEAVEPIDDDSEVAVGATGAVHV